jgi:hypothetical protein
MNRFKKKTFLLPLALCALSALVALGGCQKKEEPQKEEEPTAPVVQEVARSPLTGLPISKELEGKRPMAIMINNVKKSIPQSGVGSADVIYECRVEGEFTRLMLVMDDYENLPTTGSVRSSREYFLDFAANHGAIYTHAGGSQEAYAQMKSRNIDHMDGVNMSLPDTFWRDSWRKKNMGLEHSLMTNGEGLVAGIQQLGIDTQLPEDFTPGFSFLKEVTPLSGDPATLIKVPYTGYITAQFDYDSQSGTYLKSQYGAPHIDTLTQEQLSFQNVLVLFAPHKLRGDKEGHVDVDFTGTGEGYYCSTGTMVPIQWQKDDPDEAMTLTTADGKPLQMNPGKTYVSVAATDIQQKVTIE